ncbi:hypothetical protein M406DRAFT_62523 [Cryphonectria parasitica EP155]|uniref:Uncharacterized protein n=1 Tax=Cryphonectria parasitica (strain ATCC 38755 / EP155) TaxID=660469 RepID=A0A9P4Y0M8_CRYP1|nr:uncharacterized protein M406DRAFT_62523 [Cryphonectria parasitica EP155]KAF3764217.1 hypothetical protein M406DRAFT_62523 [Cryphonectria parasitica EP155]
MYAGSACIETYRAENSPFRLKIQEPAMLQQHTALKLENVDKFLLSIMQLAGNKGFWLCHSCFICKTNLPGLLLYFWFEA